MAKEAVEVETNEPEVVETEKKEPEVVEVDAGTNVVPAGNGRVVEVSEMGRLSGKYYIDKIKHSVSGKGAYKMTLTMHKVVAWIKTASVEAVEEAKKEAASSEQYVVKSGDTLWAIAKKYLGSGTKYIQIYNDNKDIIESTAKSHGKSSSGNGHWIWPGETLTINK